MFAETIFLKSSGFLSLKACQAAFSFAIIASLSGGAAIEIEMVANKAGMAYVMYFFIGSFCWCCSLSLGRPAGWSTHKKPDHVQPAFQGTMTSDSSDGARGGVDAGVGKGNADSPIRSAKLESTS